MRRSLLALAPLLSLALAQCTSYGTDYTNNGNYNIDKSSNEYFSFSSIFSGTLVCYSGSRSWLIVMQGANPRSSTLCLSAQRAISMPARASTFSLQPTTPPSRRHGRSSRLSNAGVWDEKVFEANFGIAPFSGIPFSLMSSGAWKIVLQGNQIAVQRNINLSVGVPQVVTVTVGRVPQSHHLKRPHADRKSNRQLPQWSWA